MTRKNSKSGTFFFARQKIDKRLVAKEGDFFSEGEDF